MTPDLPPTSPDERPVRACTWDDHGPHGWVLENVDCWCPGVDPAVAPDLPTPEPTYTESDMRVLTEAALRLGRKEAGDDLRYLAEARKDYCHHCPETQNEMRDMDPTALGVHDGHATASWLADIIDGTNDAKGWLPSWRWDEWASLHEEPK